MKKLKREITSNRETRNCMLEKPPKISVWSKTKGVNTSGRNFTSYDTFAIFLS